MFALSSCAAPDHTQTSSMNLCFNILNNSYPNAGGYRGSILEELARRDEDCSEFLHLRMPSSNNQDIEVNVQQWATWDWVWVNLSLIPRGQANERHISTDHVSVSLGWVYLPSTFDTGWLTELVEPGYFRRWSHVCGKFGKKVLLARSTSLPYQVDSHW